MDTTGLPSGTVYPTLASLEAQGFLSSFWEEAEIALKEKRPLRRYYQITDSGRNLLETTLERLRLLEELRRHGQSGEPGRA